jgi:hypothetical protein
VSGDIAQGFTAGAVPEVDTEGGGIAAPSFFPNACMAGRYGLYIN